MGTFNRSVAEIEQMKVVERVLVLTNECLPDISEIRIEIRRDILGDRFDALFCVWESYRVQATFPQNEEGLPAHESSDEEILKVWESAPFDNPLTLTATSVEDAEQEVLKKYETWIESL